MTDSTSIAIMAADVLVDAFGPDRRHIYADVSQPAGLVPYLIDGCEETGVPEDLQEDVIAFALGHVVWNLGWVDVAIRNLRKKGAAHAA